MNDTPETDAFFWRKNIDWDKEVEFCRKIERERDEAREYADKLAEGLPEGMLPKDVEVLREANLGLATNIAAVTEQRDAVTLRLGKTQERMIDAERQRDKLAEALEYILGIGLTVKTKAKAEKALQLIKTK